MYSMINANDRHEEEYWETATRERRSQRVVVRQVEILVGVRIGRVGLAAGIPRAIDKRGGGGVSVVRSFYYCEPFKERILREEL